MLQEINLAALNKALTLMFGDEHSGLVTKLYTAFDAAMKEGHELGKQEGQLNMEAACDEAFDAGWEHGEIQAAAKATDDEEGAHAEGYDDGFLDGAALARSNPTLADVYVQDILNDREDEHYEAVAAALAR